MQSSSLRPSWQRSESSKIFKTFIKHDKIGQFGQVVSGIFAFQLGRLLQEVAKSKRDVQGRGMEDL